MKLSRDFVLKLKIDNGDDGKPCDVMMCTLELPRDNVEQTLTYLLISNYDVITPINTHNHSISLVQVRRMKVESMSTWDECIGGVQIQTQFVWGASFSRITPGYGQSAADIHTR